MSIGHGRPFTRHTKVSRLLAERGLNVHDLSIGADLHSRTLHDIINGKKSPSTRALVRLTIFFECEPEDILEPFYPYTREDYDRYVENRKSYPARKGSA